MKTPLITSLVGSDFLYDRPTAIDPNGIYLLDRKSCAPFIGYDYFERFVPFAAVQRICTRPESNLRHKLKTLVGLIFSVLFTGVMVMAFMNGVLILGMITILAPVCAVGCLIELFKSPGRHFTAYVDGESHKCVVDASIWKKYGHQILKLIEASGCPHESA